MPALTTRDQELVRAFRKLFDLTHEELAILTAISVRTWERVESGDVDRERATRGVRMALGVIDEIMGYLDQVPYGSLRQWAATPRRRGGSPIDLVHRRGGITQLLQQLRANGDSLT